MYTAVEDNSISERKEEKRGSEPEQKPKRMGRNAADCGRRTRGIIDKYKKHQWEQISH